MGQTVFFEERLKQFPAFPMLLFEGLERAAIDANLEVSEDNVVQLIADALQALNYPSYDLDTAASYAVRMSDMLVAEQEQTKELETEIKKSSKSGSAKRTFGQTFMDWAQSMERDMICMYLADYDVGKARYLYCEEDRAVVMRAFNLKLSSDWHKIEAQLEAVVFGMGGGGEGNDPNVEVLDIDSDNPEESKAAMDDLKSFFGGK